MNCFEARTLFAAFWRRMLEPDRRAALSEHLKGCARCEHSFRAFALSAPALHSEPYPLGGRAPAGTARRRRGATASLRAAEPLRVRLALTAAAGMLLAVGLAAYLAAARPPQSLEEALGPADSWAEMSSNPLDPVSYRLSE